MGMPVIDMKVSEASAAFPNKTVESAGKAAVENFTRIFDGCVSGCSEAAVGTGAKTAEVGGNGGSVVLVESAGFNAPAGKETANGTQAPWAEPGAVVPSSFKVAVDNAESLKNPAITVNSEATQPEMPLTVGEASGLAAAKGEGATEYLFKGDTSTVKTLPEDLAVSFHETDVESTGLTKTASATEQIQGSTTVQSSTSKTGKTQKPAKPEASRILKNNGNQAVDRVIPALTSIDMPAKKTEVKEAQDEHQAKESKSEKAAENINASTRAQRTETSVPSSALFYQQSQSDTVQAADKQADSVVNASLVSAQSNTVPEKAPERPAGASEVKASEVSVSASNDAKTLTTGKADSLPNTEVLPASSDKAGDIKTFKALSDTGSEDSYSDNAKPESLNSADDQLDKKITVKAETNTPAIKKTETSHCALPSDDLTQPASSKPSETVEAKGTAVKALHEHQSSPFAYRLDAEPPVSGAPGAQTGAEKQPNTIPVAVASGSEGLEKQDEREETGNDSRKESFLKIENTAVTLHSGANVRSSKFSAVVAEPKQAGVRADAVFEKLDTGVRMSLGKGGKDVSLSLSPEHLGQLHIKLNVDESTVKARIVVESDAAKAILDTDSGKLKEVFARQGLTLDKCTIELSTGSNPSGGGGFTENGAGENTSGRPSSWARSGARDEDTAGTKAYAQPENIRRSTGGVDLFA